jgi:hypothetical protein
MKVNCFVLLISLHQFHFFATSATHMLYMLQFPFIAVWNCGSNKSTETIKVLTHFVNCCYFHSAPKKKISFNSDCSVLNQLSWLLLIVDTQRHERKFTYSNYFHLLCLVFFTFFLLFIKEIFALFLKNSHEFDNLLWFRFF